MTGGSRRHRTVRVPPRQAASESTGYAVGFLGASVRRTRLSDFPVRIVGGLGAEADHGRQAGSVRVDVRRHVIHCRKNPRGAVKSHVREASEYHQYTEQESGTYINQRVEIDGDCGEKYWG